jgi:hypothetical protein
MTMMAETKALGEKPVPLPLLITTNPTRTDLESHPGLFGKTASLHAYSIDLQKRMAFCKWMSNVSG